MKNTVGVWGVDGYFSDLGGVVAFYINGEAAKMNQA